MSSIRFVAVLLFGSLFGLVSFSRADDVKTLGGKNYSGTITSISETELVIDTKDGVVKLRMSQVLAVDRTKPADLGNAKYTEVRLQDESVFRAAKVEFLGKDVKLTLLSKQEVTVPFDSLLMLRHDAHDATNKKAWDKILSKRIKNDLLVKLFEGDLIDLDGTFGDVDAKAQSVLFNLKKGDTVVKIDQPLDSLKGMVFFRTDALAATPICKVFDNFGNEATAVSVASDGKEATLTTAYKKKISMKLADIAKFDFNMGKLYYLSDLEPAKVVERSGAGLVVKYKKDANLDGERIVLEKSYDKGLSMHAHTELEYNLAGKYKEFKAIVGVDKRTGDQSQALVTIYCDGEKRFSETVTGKEKAIGINLKEVNVLKIVVSSKNFLDLHDHATLAEAKISQ